MKSNYHCFAKKLKSESQNIVKDEVVQLYDYPERFGIL